MSITTPARTTDEINAKPGSNSGTKPAPPCTIVIFGAGGDLTKRLLMPALYDLAASSLLPDEFSIVGVDHNASNAKDWGQSLTETMQSFVGARSGAFHPSKLDETTWSFITSRLHYVTADFENAQSFKKIGETLGEIERTTHSASAIFYLAVSPRFFGPIVDNLGAAKLLDEPNGTFRRVIIEKPFGADEPSARALDARILAVMDESQAYRIDHFLGKEAVQSIMALRFGNGLFEPMWRREYVDHVQITASETVGVEERAGFYEATGALRDMVPNHLFQLLATTAMEPPNSFDAQDVRDAKSTLLGAVQPVRPTDVVRGQYAPGTNEGKAVPGYRDEHGVAPTSVVETYAAMKVRIENWRWSGVPFYLRTGKRLKTRLTTIAIHFKPAPYQLFRDTPVDEMTPNVTTLQIDPLQGMTTDFSVKVPGPTMKLGRVATSFRYGDFFAEPPNVGYETLIFDCMRGDATLFQRADHIETGWHAVQPVLDSWAKGEGSVDAYAAGSEGPSSAALMLARDGRTWLPLVNELANEPAAKR